MDAGGCYLLATKNAQNRLGHSLHYCQNTKINEQHYQIKLNSE